MVAEIGRTIGTIVIGAMLDAGERIAGSFGAANAQSMVTQPFGKTKLAITHLCRFYEVESDPVVLPADDAFLVVLYLADVEHCDLWPNRLPTPLRTYPKGSICLISLEHGASISIKGQFEALAFHIPRQHLKELREEAGEPHIDDLTICRGIEDRIISNIGAAMMSFFEMPENTRHGLLLHVGLAFSSHIAHCYGRSRQLH